MAKKRIRAVLVGCGAISGGWFSALAAMADVEIVGLVDIVEAAAEGARDRCSLTGAEVGSDLRAIIKRTAPDVVFNCTVPEAHLAVTLTALKSGCHVLGEKPLAANMVEARRLVRAATAAKRIFAVIQNRRYTPNIRAYSRTLASGKIGSLTTLNADFYLGPHFGGFRDKMKHPLLLDMAIHSFDEARFISGADPRRVYCREWNPKGSWYAHGASAVAVFRMTDDIVFTYRGSWCAEGVDTSWDCEWRAVGTSGTACWDGADGFQAERVTGDGGWTRPRKPLAIRPTKADKRDGHAGNIREFLNCVRNGGDPETVATDNIKSLAMVMAAIESAETGREVAVRW